MKRYLQVLLPLKLDWIPYYWTENPDITVGDRVKASCSGRVYSGVVCSISDHLPEGLPERKVLPVEGLDEGLERIRPESMEFWNDIAGYYLCTPGEVFKNAFPAMKLDWEKKNARRRERLELKLAKTRSALEKARASTKERYSLEIKELEKSLADLCLSSIPDMPVTLSEYQEKAFRMIQSSQKNVLLHGVTSSGKTEIYTALAHQELKKGRNVLYLVPEIALSRQLEERLRSYFGECLLIFHSHETPARRGYAASKVASGAPYIILGTRSSLFLPHHDLGLIIVDEEHDSSFKQDNPAPRYNARDTAIMLASHMDACKVVMGSATPSLEALRNSSLGKFTYVRLDKKYYDAPDAPVEIINTIEERKKHGMSGSFSYKLVDIINDTLNRGDQVIILRGRRSYSPYVQCRECGTIPRCPVCNVSMSYHKDRGRLVCHHCGHWEIYTGKCRECGGELAGMGSGTQKIEEEARNLFPNAVIARLDSDVTSNPKEEEKVIRDFSDGKTNILIGTQIVSKGFDFCKLGLVVVIQADSLMAVDDFRADEKAFQTLSQLRGRCSRRQSSGLFVIQTSQSDHPVYRKLLANDHGLEDFMQERKIFGYPPFKRLVNINIADEYEGRADNMGARLASELRGRRLAVAGPFAPQNAIREGGKHLRSLRIALDRDRNLADNKKAIRETVSRFEKENKYAGHISIDVDPT